MQYDYKMIYVPSKEDIVSPDLFFAEESGCEDGSASLDSVTEAALNAIQTMNAMCAMVYMKCMELMNREEE